MDEKDKNEQHFPEEESNAARRIRMLGQDTEEEEDEELEIDRWGNFWYHQIAAAAAGRSTERIWSSSSFSFL